MTKQKRINNLIVEFLHKSVEGPDKYDLEGLVDCAHLVIVGKKIYTSLANLIILGLINIDDNHIDNDDRVKIDSCRREVYALFEPWRHCLKNYTDLRAVLNRTADK